MKSKSSSLQVKTKKGNSDVYSPLFLEADSNTPTKHLSSDSLYSVNQWTVDQVSEWLVQCGFSNDVISTFRTHQIDGKVLLLLNESDLRQSPLRMNILGEIKRMSLAIQQLRIKWKRQLAASRRREELESDDEEEDDDEEEEALDDDDVSEGDGSAGSVRFARNLEEHVEEKFVNEQQRTKVQHTKKETKQQKTQQKRDSTRSSKDTTSKHLSKRKKQFMGSMESLEMLFNGEETLPEALGLLWEHYLPSLTVPSPELEPWSSMLSKLFVSFCFFLISIFVTSLTMVFVHERVPDPLTYPPLPDIVLDNLPLIPWAFAASEILASTLFIIMACVLFVHKYRGVIMRRMFAVVATVFLMRCITMFVTSLSVPGQHLAGGCKALPPLETVDAKLKRAWLIASRFGLSITGLKTCGDYMFSGHSSVLTLINLFIVEYTPKNYRGLHIMTWAINLFGMAFVLAAHEHYTLDVFAAFYISSRIFGYYHHNVNIQHALDGIDNKGKKDTWFVYIPLFSYLEENMSGKLPSEYEWPWKPLLDMRRRRLERIKSTSESKKEN